MSKRIQVTEFSVSPSVIFLCVFCHVAIESRQSGPYHRSTGDHCKQCGAYYVIVWDEETRQPAIEMERDESIMKGDYHATDVI